MPQMVANGELGSILNWLRENVHRHGRRYNSEELCKRITGQGLDASFFIRYIEAKYKDIYGI